MFEASISTDLTTMRPMLEKILAIFDDNFDETHVSQLIDIAKSVSENDKEMVSLKVTYNNKEQNLIYAIKNDGGSLEMYFFSEFEELINQIGEIQIEYCEENGI